MIRVYSVLLPALTLAKSGSRNPNFNINELGDWSSLGIPTNIALQQGNNDKLAQSDTAGEPINPEDYRASDFVEEMWDEANKDPIFTAGLFEGDIDNVPLDALKKGEQRNAIRDNWRKWPGATIPYLISSSFSQYERSVIAKAMKNYHDKTCIRFRPRTSEQAYIHIMKGSGCSSSVGKTGSQQSVSLGNGCVYTGIVMHELMHAAGFWHEQSRADRDSHIRINWQNIIKGMEYNFLKYDLNKIDHLDAAYDTCSVMHYGAYAFSKGRQPTIQTIKPGKCSLGQREGFSDIDIKKLNTLYKCTGYPQTGSGGSVITKPTTTTPKPWVKPDCTDQNKHCATWAKADECKKNPSWMLVYCPVACEQCKVTCIDNNVYCEDWAKQGECKKNPDYMNIYCPKACNACSSKCKDENDNCKKWAKGKLCSSSKYKDYMSLRCKKSCGQC